MPVGDDQGSVLRRVVHCQWVPCSSVRCWSSVCWWVVRCRVVCSRVSGSPWYVPSPSHGPHPLRPGPSLSRPMFPHALPITEDHSGVWTSPLRLQTDKGT